MKNKILFLGSLCLILALSLAFVGCSDDPVFSGDPFPWYLTGEYEGPGGEYLSVTADGVQFNLAAPYRTSVEYAGDVDTGAGDGTVTFYLYATPFAEVGSATITFNGIDQTTQTLTFDYDEEALYPYGLPNGVFTKLP